MFDALADRDRARMILAMRLAVILAHARGPVELPTWSLKHGKSIELALDGAWMSHHPLTQFLLEEEGAHWERVGVAFEVRQL